MYNVGRGHVWYQLHVTPLPVKDLTMKIVRDEIYIPTTDPDTGEATKKFRMMVRSPDTTSKYLRLQDYYRPVQVNPITYNMTYRWDDDSSSPTYQQVVDFR